MDPVTRSVQDTLTESQALIGALRSDAKSFEKLVHSSLDVSHTLSERTVPQFNELARELEEAVAQINALTSENSDVIPAA